MSTFFIFLLLFLLPILGGLLAISLKSKFNTNIKLFLSFSGSFLLSVCLIHLLPEVFESGENIGFYILIGFFIQILLDFFSEGIEHGHAHSSGNENQSFPLVIFISLCIHAFIEGFPLAGYLEKEHSLSSYASALLTGIILHKVPIAIVLTILLMSRKVKNLKIILALCIFSFMAPLSMLSYKLTNNSLDFINLTYLTAIAIGIFLHISTVILFESSQNHKFNFLKFGTVLLGILVAILSFGTHG